MVEPIKILNGLRTAEQRVSDFKHGLELADRLANVDDRMAHLQKLIDTEEPRMTELSDDTALASVMQDIKDRVFQLTDVEASISRIEARLGQDASDPVDLTLQQTLDVVEHLRQISQAAPNDERIASLATNVCEGLESFVTTVLAGSEAEGNTTADSPSIADMELALNVIDTIAVCPGAARQSMYRPLRRQFIDVACQAAWKRVDRLSDMGLDRATRKEYLHEALTIWTLTPDLAENAGSPRLSQLPSEIQRFIQRLLLKEVIANGANNDLPRLQEEALLTKEFIDDYLSMVPAISLPDAHEAIGLHVVGTLVRRLESAIREVASSEDLELCFGIITTLRTLEGVDETRLERVSRSLARARWRVRAWRTVLFFRRASLTSALVLVAAVAALGAYIGIAALIEYLYEFTLPLAP